MNSNSPRKTSILLSLSLVLIFLTGCAAPTRVRLHPEFVNNPESVNSIALLPLDCHVKYYDLSDENTNHPGREREIDSLIAPLIPKILESQKYDVQTRSIPPDSQDSTDFLEWVAEMRASHAASLLDMYPRGNISMEEVLNFPGQVSPEVVSNYTGPETDAFLLVKYSGFKRSSGAMAAGLGGGIALGVLTGVAVIPYPEGGTMQAALVDATSGNILWHNFATIDDYSLEKLLERLLVCFPDNNENLLQYTSSGESISHPFRVKNYRVSDNLIPQAGEDHIVLMDGSEYAGEIIDVSKRNCVIKNRRTVYIINRKKISSVSIAGEVVSATYLSGLDFPRVNYNKFDDKVQIY